MSERHGHGGAGAAFPRVALGCGNFGGIGSAPELFGKGTSEEEAFRIMDAAWELGIEWFDTADAYGGGRSEAMIGKWMERTGRRPFVTTKTFNPMEAGGDHGLAPERIVRQITGSLERLGVDSVDLYLAHSFDPDTPLEETFAAFDDLVRAGTIRAYGVSNFAADELGAAVRVGNPALIQNAYSLLERDDERGVLPLCAANGVAYQAYSPLAGGWLTGKYRRGEPPPPGSRMTLRPGPYLDLDNERTYRGVDRLAVGASERGVSGSALALAWVLGHPDVTAIVVGPSRPQHLEPVREALALELSPDERDEIASFFS
ncbi:MAG: aldo/keto reductase [Actinomycetota bacterium]|nr:aldo/keto reductase [Actinomycetota bacterium]